MKVTRIEVENFRSIETYDFEVSDFNIFVGQNNHGKTNLFDALDWFDSGKTSSTDKHNYNQDLIIKIRVHFNGVQAAIDEIPNQKYQSTIKNAVEDADEIIVEKTSINDKRCIIVNGENKGNPAGFDAALNYFLPKVEYVTTKVRLNDVSGIKSKSPIAEMLSSVLEDVVNTEPKYQDFIDLFNEIFNSADSIFRDAVKEIETKVETYLQKQFSEDTKVDFKISDPAIADMLKGFEAYINDGIRTKAEEKGDGMQRAMMLAIIQSYADYRKEKNIARNFIFLIDEAELHLHPSGQRALKKALRDITERGGQVFISTHSSVFANESFKNQIIYNVQKEERNSNLETVLSEQERLNSIYNLLGGSPTDLLLPNNFIIVEGPSEYHFLTNIISRFYSDNKKAVNIKILFARGDHERQAEVYHKVHETYRPLLTNGIYKDRVVFMFDTPAPDKQKSYEEFKSIHKWLEEGEHLHTIPQTALEKYYPDPFKKTDDEITEMDKNREKTSYAVEVSKKISLEQFQTEMPVVYQMLEKAIEKAYE